MVALILALQPIAEQVAIMVAVTLILMVASVAVLLISLQNQVYYLLYLTIEIKLS